MKQRISDLLYNAGRIAKLLLCLALGHLPVTFPGIVVCRRCHLGPDKVASPPISEQV